MMPAPRRPLGLTALALAAPLLAAAAGCDRSSSHAEVEPLAATSGGLGETPTIETHLDQAKIESGEVGFEALFSSGETLFAAVFNELDGQGRPASTGTGAPRNPTAPAFIRTSAPDASSCFGCHNQPRVGGAGDFVANVFVLAQAKDPVTFSVADTESNERNTLGMFGAGPIEMLAREMTGELLAIRAAAKVEAAAGGASVTKDLVAKGVSFGKITATPAGLVDGSQIEGVDWDLVVKPFHQKGAVVSLREFSNNAMNHHHGMQSVERFGADTDPDGDGVKNELTAGDITAVTIFQAALPVPGRMLPSSPSRVAMVERGEALFDQVGCASCHIPSFTLDGTLFTEPNPFNPAGNLRTGDVSSLVRFDMAKEGPSPRLERSAEGKGVVRAFTDLKRHDLNDADFTFFANEKIAQGSLAGFDAVSTFTTTPPARPLRQFLTRKLWDVGNSAPFGHRGDLTTLTAAIKVHGGEARASRDAYFALSSEDRAAVVELLKTLQVLPEGSSATEVDPRR